MKYFRSGHQVFAFELDGTQDHLITSEMILLDASESSGHLEINGQQSDCQAAFAAISLWRARQEITEITFKHAGHIWDAGLKSQSRIEPLLKLEALPDGFFWTDHEDNDVPVTMDELRAIAAAMNLAIVERGFAIHQRQREMKQQLESMTAEELLAFEPGWPE